MKEIQAYVKHFKVNDLVKYLIDSGFPNITISMSEGTGTFERGNSEISTQFSISNSQVAKIELICSNLDEDIVVDIISRYGRTGNSGDGIIYISNVNKAIKVKTGEEIQLDKTNISS